MKQIDKNKKRLFKNTAMLYVLQFSTYFLSFLSLPYQTRVLGPAMYGVVGVAVATMAYFQLFMDFGFLLSATEDISLNRNDRVFVSKKLTSVAVIKMVFFVFSISLVLIFTIFLKPFSEYKALYILYVLAYGVNSFLPDYFFRGIEKMTSITFRTVAVKLFSTILTFVFLQTKEDYLAIPVLMLIGNVGAVIWAYFYIYKTLKYPFEKVTISEVLFDFKRSASFFLARIASTVYSATNAVIIGYVDTTGVATGYFTSADKVMTIAKSTIAPISDSLYPYMVKNRNFSMIKKIFLFIEPVILVGCIVVWVFAEPICVIAFGEEFAGTAPVLRGFIPAIAVLLPSYILGFPTLGAMKLAKYANYSIFFGTTIHIIGLCILFVTSNIDGVTLAFLTSLSETAIMLFRLFAVIKNRKVFQEVSVSE